MQRLPQLADKGALTSCGINFSNASVRRWAEIVALDFIATQVARHRQKLIRLNTLDNQFQLQMLRLTYHCRNNRFAVILDSKIAHEGADNFQALNR